MRLVSLQSATRAAEVVEVAEQISSEFDSCRVDIYFQSYIFLNFICSIILPKTVDRKTLNGNIEYIIYKRNTYRSLSVNDFIALALEV